MARRIDMLCTSFEASSAGLCVARFRKKWSQRSLWMAEEDVLQNHERPTDSRGPWRISRSAHNLKPTWQATRVIAYTDRDLCHIGWSWRRGLHRNQSGQRSKRPRGVLLSF